MSNCNIFTRQTMVNAKLFDKEKTVTAYITEEAYEMLKKNPNYVFTQKEVLYVERVEDYYATPHYKGKVAVRIKHSDWRPLDERSTAF